METEAKHGNVVLSLQNVNKVFKNDVFKPRQDVIKNLSCDFIEGQCTGLLGHNGAGKTTSIRLILGLIRPDSGTIAFQGAPITTKAKSLIGYMPEVNKLPAGLTCEEVLHHHLILFHLDQFKSKNEREQAVSAKLQEVNLAEHRKKKVAKLSKGMGRRLAWAQATIHNPKLLILDEPSSGLDPLGRSEMLSWIAHEKKKGTSIILCTHELAQISQLCEEFHVLKRGQLVMTSMPTIAQKNGSTCALFDWTQKFSLHVSGLGEDQLRRIAHAQKLQMPQRIKKTGQSSVMGFDSYETAAAWVRELTEEGCMILKFSEELVLTEDDIATYFRSEG